MRTLSARILLGFAALTIAFGVITGTDIRNMWAVENEAKLVRAGYMLLAFSSRDLARREEDYRTYLSDALQDDPNPIAARINLQRTKTNRDNALARTREILDKLSHSTEFGARQFAPTRVRVDAIDRAIVEISPLYLAVYAFPPLGREDVPGTEMARYALSRLRDSERRTATMANVLAEDLERNVRMRMSHLEGNEHLLRIITIYLGVAALLLALLITIWVVITLRPLRRLRDGARRVAAADYASRIDERGPSEVLDLAREFNSMARAVEERERELVRQERLAAVGKMAAMITHEVRNPLSSIGLNTELLEEELASGSDEARKLCASITRSTGSRRSPRTTSRSRGCRSRRSHASRSTSWSARSRRSCARTWPRARSRWTSSPARATRSRCATPRSSASASSTSCATPRTPSPVRARARSRCAPRGSACES